MRPPRFPKIKKAVKRPQAPKIDVEKTPPSPKELSAEENARLDREYEKQEALKFLKDNDIKVGSIDQLQYPQTIPSTIDDPELAKYATDLGMRLKAQRLAPQPVPSPELPIQNKPKILTVKELQKYQEENKKLKERLRKEFEETKAEGVRDIYLPKSKAAMVGGAVGAGTLAASELAQASEGPTISQSNPEFASDVVQPESKDPLLHFEQKYGTYDIPGGVEKLLESVDKYTGRPVRAAALSALKGKNPITGAVESVSKDQDVEGRQVARQFLENLEESGFKTRPPVDPRLEQLRQLGVEIEGKKPEEYLPSNEFPAEAPLGFAADMALDPTNLAGMGLGTKVGKGFSKIRGLMK